MDAEHTQAITIPIAAVLIAMSLCWAAVEGCKTHHEFEKVRIEAGQIEVYDPVANRLVWRFTTNTSLRLEE